MAPVAGKSFRNFWGDFGPGGPADSCKWSLGSQGQVTVGSLGPAGLQTSTKGAVRGQLVYCGFQAG